MESVGNVLGDYTRTIQPSSLAFRKNSGSSPSSDIARLEGSRFINASELPSDLKLNVTIIKQLTGGDHVTARFLYKNDSEYMPQFKIFISTNHLPEIEDDTLFASRRLKLIPFDRHFNDKEQNHGLKKLFREDGNKSAILNWLIEGYKRYIAEGLTPPEKAEELLHKYRESSNPVGLYVENRLISCDERERTATSKFYFDFIEWCKKEGVTTLSLKGFVQALRQKDLLGRDRDIGHYIKGFAIKKQDGE